MGGDGRREYQLDTPSSRNEVLYVDADRETAQAVSEALCESGEFTVQTRTTPETALAFLETQRVDVVVSAADLQESTGVAFFGDVRAADPTVPFVLVAESDSERLVREALSAGVDGYLTKSEGSDALAAQLQTVVSANRTMVASLSSRLASDALSAGSSGLGCVVAPDGTVQHLTETMERKTGVDVEQSLGDPLWTQPWWPAGEQGSAVEGYVEAAATGDVVEFQSPIECVDGTRTVFWMLLPVQSGTTVVSILLAGTDITPLVRRNDQLERANRRLEEFSSVVSHDLRSPLTVAGGHLELASRECDSDHLDHAKMALLRMERLIEDLRTMARHGQAVGDLTDVSLSTAAKNAWASVDTGDARLVVDGDVTVCCDETRLWQLFENLFRNSVEHGSTGPRSHTREDSVEHGSTSSRATSDDPLTVTVGPLDDGTGFFVEDTGVGIPADDHETVFEMGYSSTPDSTGFGLAIVEEIVNAHHWEISVSTGADGGARFEIVGVETVADAE